MMAEAVSDKASHRPMPSPKSAPMTKPKAVSRSVTPRWTKISPLQNQSTIVQNTLTGSPKKKGGGVCRSKENGGLMPGVVKTCHSTMSAAKTTNCIARSRISGDLLLLVGLQHFFLHRPPDLLVEREESRRHADLRHVARPRQVDPEVADRMRARPRRQHHDAVGQRDRLLEIVGDEQHR